MRASELVTWGEGCFASALAKVRVNRVNVGEREVHKERRLGAGSVIALGNVYFRMAGALFRMFPSLDAWFAHEAQMFHALHGLGVRRDRRTLVMPRLPGRDLLVISRDSTDVAAFSAAGLALAELHRRGLSHGDVNLGNLIFDGHVARLIDFDAAHAPTLPIAARAADDLLGFVLDAIARGGEAFEGNLAAFFEAYQAPSDVARSFCELAHPRGILARSLLRARAHGASASDVAAGLTVAERFLEG